MGVPRRSNYKNTLERHFTNQTTGSFTKISKPHTNETHNKRNYKALKGQIHHKQESIAITDNRMSPLTHRRIELLEQSKREYKISMFRMIEDVTKGCHHMERRQEGGKEGRQEGRKAGRKARRQEGRGRGMGREREEKRRER